MRILGSGFRAPELRRPQVRFGEKEGAIVISALSWVVNALVSDSGRFTLITRRY